jgi:hypothetical protein
MFNFAVNAAKENPKKVEKLDYKIIAKELVFWMR